MYMTRAIVVRYVFLLIQANARNLRTLRLKTVYLYEKSKSESYSKHQSGRHIDLYMSSARDANSKRLKALILKLLSQKAILKHPEL